MLAWNNQQTCSANSAVEHMAPLQFVQMPDEGLHVLEWLLHWQGAQLPPFVALPK